MRTHHEQIAIVSLSDAAAELNAATSAVGQASRTLRIRHEQLGRALLDAAMYAGMTRSDMARVTGYSRRQVGRMLREASALI
jgi:ABC-type transporter Mla subunit MlaD